MPIDTSYHVYEFGGYSYPETPNKTLQVKDFAILYAKRKCEKHGRKVEVRQSKTIIARIYREGRSVVCEMVPFVHEED